VLSRLLKRQQLLPVATSASAAEEHAVGTKDVVHSPAAGGKPQWVVVALEAVDRVVQEVPTAAAAAVACCWQPSSMHSSCSSRMMRWCGTWSMRDGNRAEPGSR
jgi:hypothetical protein